MDIEKQLENLNGGKNPFLFTDLGVLISNFIDLFIKLAGVFALVFLIWGGIEWITSGGDKAGAEKAKSRITDAMIGLVVVLSAWAVFQAIQIFFGFKITKGEVPKSSPATQSQTVSCEPKKAQYVMGKGCKNAQGNPDWTCWKNYIEARPCENFNDGTGSYWPRSGCTTPANLCQ